MLARNFSIIPALLLGAAVLLAGCANDADPGGGSSTPSASAPSDGAPSVDLQISIRADGTNESDHYSLQCNGPEASARSVHPSAEEVCALIVKEPQILAEPTPDANTACTQQYGGPAVARVSGTLDGKAVERRFDLSDGCAISEWNAASALLVVQPGLQ